MNSRQTHEKYHKKTHAQFRIISDNNFTHRHQIKVLNKFLKTKKKILDIGCGAGTLSFYLASKHHEVLGVDISKKAIKESTISSEHMGLKNVKFKVLDFPKEIPDGRYDAILLFEVIEHIKDDVGALRKIFKLLKPGGVLLLSTPSIKAPLHRLGLTKQFDKNVGHLRRYDLDDLVKKIEDAGFKIKYVQKIEGVLRNFLFVDNFAGNFLRFVKFFVSDIITFIDDASLKLFGESNYLIVAVKK